jgi:hypothetical protein
MRVVWKFPLNLTNNLQVMHMPTDAKIVHVAAQNDRPTMWAECRPEGPVVTRVFKVYPTGLSIDEGSYVGTVHIGWTVWHVYEVTN